MSAEAKRLLRNAPVKCPSLEGTVRTKLSPASTHKGEARRSRASNAHCSLAPVAQRMPKITFDTDSYPFADDSSSPQAHEYAVHQGGAHLRRYYANAMLPHILIKGKYDGGADFSLNHSLSLSLSLSLLYAMQPHISIKDKHDDGAALLSLSRRYSIFLIL